MLFKADSNNRAITLLAASILIGASLLVYGFVVNLFFFQDDFFLLFESRIHTLADIYNQFRIRADVVYYRPLSMQLWFGFGQLLWGKNPILFHTIALLVHLSNTLLVWKVVHRMTGNLLVGFVTAFFFGTALLHFIALSWIAEFSLILITFVFLLALHYLLSWIQRGKGSLLVATYTLSLIAYLIHELAIVFPFLFLWVLVLYKKTHMRVLAPLLVTAILYTGLRLWVFPQAGDSSYRMSLSFETVKTLAWYGAWSLQIPEEMYRQVDRLIPFTINAQFMKDFPAEMRAMQILTWVLMLSCGIGIFLVGKRRLFLWYLGWFVIGLGPFILLPAHAYPMYATIGAIGLFSGIAYVLVAGFSVLRKKLRALVLALVLATWLFSGLILQRFTYLTHWTMRINGLSETYIRKVAAHEPYIPYGATVRLPSEKSLRLALMDEYGLKVLVRDDLQTAYTDEETRGVINVYTIQ